MKRAIAIYAIIARIGVSLCGCASDYASIREGKFDVFAPTPYTGAAFSMDEKSSAMRASLQIHKYDEESLKLNGLMNEGKCGNDGCLPHERANIAYDFKRFPVTGAFDYFSKNRISMWGAGIGLDPYPFIRTTAGINSRFIEAGVSAYLSVGNNTYDAKGEWLHKDGIGWYDDTRGEIDCEDCHEITLHGGFGGYINVFPIKPLAISYAPFFYRPWWDDEIQNREISFQFPYIISQYFGVSYLIARHVQVSAGASVYVGEAFAGRYWFFDSGIGFVF